MKDRTQIYECPSDENAIIYFHIKLLNNLLIPKTKGEYDDCEYDSNNKNKIHINKFDNKDILFLRQG